MARLMQIARRARALPIAVLLALAPLALASASKGEFRFEADDDGASIRLWEGDRPVLVYRAGPTRRASAPRANPRGSYVHPIHGLDGEILTDDFPADHVNHRGLYFAWPHVRVGGREYDSWNVPDLRTVFRRWVAREAGERSAVLAVENAWVAGGEELAREVVRYTVLPATADARAIDVEYALTAGAAPLTLRGAAGKSYGGLALRYAPRATTTVITTPGGRSEDQVVARQPWADLSGDFRPMSKGAGAAGGDDRVHTVNAADSAKSTRAADTAKATGAASVTAGSPGHVMSGIAVLVHPQHPDFPPDWMTRHYGMLAVGWPGVEARTLAANETITMQYRLWIHRGAGDAEALRKAYDGYATAPATRNVKD